MKSFNYKKTKGFTLIEIMVAVFVFSVVMVLATGAIFNIIAANKTSQALKSVIDNLSSALDSMSREVRYGSVYNCGFIDDSDFATPNSCADNSTVSKFAFVDRNAVHVIYEFQAASGGDGSGSIYKCIGNDNTNNIPNPCTLLTAPEVHITNLHFYVQGAERSEWQQPQLLMTISGYAQAGPNHSLFNIETMVDQRNLDLCKNPPIIPLGLRSSSCPTP